MTKMSFTTLVLVKVEVEIVVRAVLTTSDILSDGTSPLEPW